jgi:hypothetical protein
VEKGRPLDMQISAIQFSETFLESVADLGEDAREGLLSSLELKVFEPAVDPAAVFADDPGIVGWVVLDGEDAATTFLTLKGDSNQVQGA